MDTQSYGELVAQANLIGQTSRKCRARARHLRAKAKSVRARRLRSSNSNLAMYLEGLAMILDKVARLDASNPWYKSAGDGKRIDKPEWYVLRCNQLMKLKAAQMESLVDKWLEIEPNVAARYIPKVGEKAGLRPLGVPGHFSKALETILTPFVDSVMIDKVGDIGYYGYKKGHSCHKAIRDLRNQWVSGKYKYAIMLDQSGAFNSLTPEAKQLAYQMLPKWCRGMVEKFTERPQFKDIKDAKWQFRKETDELVVWYTGTPGNFSTHYIKKYNQNGPVVETIKGLHGTPQGGVLSPRIYMLAQSIAYRNIPGIAGVVYADDAVILTNRDPEEVKGELIREFGKLGLKVNPAKSKVSDTHASLLGWTISKDGHMEIDQELYRGRLGPHKDGESPRQWELEILAALECLEVGVKNNNLERAYKFFKACYRKYPSYLKKVAWGKFKYYANGITPTTLKGLCLDSAENTEPLVLTERPFIKKLLKVKGRKNSCSSSGALMGLDLDDLSISDWEFDQEFVTGLKPIVPEGTLDLTGISIGLPSNLAGGMQDCPRWM